MKYQLEESEGKINYLGCINLMKIGKVINTLPFLCVVIKIKKLKI